MLANTINKIASYIVIGLFIFSTTTVKAQTQTIFITKDIKVAKPVSPLLYGSMMEPHLNWKTGGIPATMKSNGF